MSDFEYMREMGLCDESGMLYELMEDEEEYDLEGYSDEEMEEEEEEEEEESSFTFKGVKY